MNESRGLTRLREGSDRRNMTQSSPQHKCPNCKCSRYNPCGCQKSLKKKEKEG